ncbi:L-carnitine dehydratase/bile acid-inducible protein F [Mycolicibacterium thermoresistibile ATCC 19527]|uniref:L-carnitine dehydratase/bile acid-inducible protein F n=1 Tax=Mycolicibacterium thermoresistibile (strain ATCC 19527 / DSM 44167 / CIP 105390 / JCM 6362 / NCTC 10409 / 316) TaxID=1078020 RepID=G7CFV4_MYCT3|nr:L-carnitine dehydratase/bile acid-inducible protein F [Mycolicibacterium thermoresistibile ATCC 19527]
MRVLQIGDGIAGSAAAALLASLGAAVARIPSTSRTGTPRTGPHLAGPHGPVAAVDFVLDHRKRILDAGADPAEHARDADIVFVDGAAVPPVDGPTVVVELTPFGADGPAHPGGELVAQASGGLMATIEDSDGRPVPAPGYVALKAAGAVAALAALHGLDRRGSSPVHVDMSIQEAVIYTAALPECAHVMYRCPGRAGSGRYLAPSGVFPCRDGLVRITAVENHQWTGLVKAFGRPDWAAGLDDRPARIEHADLINAKVTEWTRDRLKADCAAILQANGVPSSPVNLPGELLTSPQLAHRKSLYTGRIGDRDVTVLGPPWRIDLGDRRPTRPDGLRGLRIAELTHVLAGPIIGSLLGAMGATVVRLEDPDRLDIYRRSGPFAEGIAGVERGAYYAVANHSKRSVLINPEHAADDVAAALAQADVVIENVGSSRLNRLNVSPERLAASGRLMVRVSGFGSDGPLAGYRVYANNVQSYGGLAGLTTEADGRPARLGTVLADPLSSVVAAVVIAAWAVGPRADTGAVIDLSMSEVVGYTVAEYVTAASTEQGAPASAVHRGVYPAADSRWVAVELTGDEPVDSADLPAQIASLPAQDAAAKLTSAGVRAAVVRSATELVGDPHLAARGFFPEIAHPDPQLRTGRLVGLPWRFAGAGPVPLSPPPALGSTPASALYERTPV